MAMAVAVVMTGNNPTTKAEIIMFGIIIVVVLTLPGVSAMQQSTVEHAAKESEMSKISGSEYYRDGWRGSPLLYDSYVSLE